MMMRNGAAVALSCLYWAFALVLSGLALLAPCGFAPGEWCEDEGSNGFGATLAFLGPGGVLLVAVVIYAATFRFIRQRKVR